MSARRILITVILLLITAQARAISLKDFNAESKTEQAQAVTGFIDLSIEESWLLWVRDFQALAVPMR